MENLKSMKHCLVSQAHAQMGNLQNVDAKELGEVIDMIKDLEEAIYYCTITEAMEKKDKEEQHNHYYYPYMETDGRMYYEGRMQSSDNRNYANNNNNGNGRNYYEYPIELRDYREGQSPKSRRMYMEAKQKHYDKTTQMMELEKYMKELGSDITEMIEDATPEERELLKNKLTKLVQKIDHN